MSPAETGQMISVARTYICLVTTHNVEVAADSTVAMSQCSSLRGLNCGNVTMFKSQKSQLFNSQIGGLALIDENGPKWVQNGRQVLRIGPRASPGHFLGSGTDPAAQSRQNIAQTPDQPPPAAAMLSTNIGLVQDACSSGQV